MHIKQLIKAQMKLERQHAKQNQADLVKMFLRDFKGDVVEAATNLELHIRTFDPKDYEYVTKKGEARFRHDLKEVHEEMLKKDLEAIMWRVLALVVPKHQVTLQQAVGACVGAFSGLSNVSRQLKAACLILEYLPLCEILTVKGAERGYVISMIELDKEESDALNQMGVVLPSIAPLKKVRNNSQTGYRTFGKSLVMGGKHHDYDMQLAHINKRNRVGFVLDKEIAGRVMAGKLGAFDPTPQYNKKTNKLETRKEIQERKQSWTDLHSQLNQKLQVIGNSTMYFSHRRDNRGRTYCEAYHINYQGLDWQKALVSLEKEEYVEPEF